MDMHYATLQLQTSVEDGRVFAIHALELLGYSVWSHPHRDRFLVIGGDESASITIALAASERIVNISIVVASCTNTGRPVRNTLVSLYQSNPQNRGG